MNLIHKRKGKAVYNEEKRIYDFRDFTSTSVINTLYKDTHGDPHL